LVVFVLEVAADAHAAQQAEEHDEQNPAPGQSLLGLCCDAREEVSMDERSEHKKRGDTKKTKPQKSYRYDQERSSICSRRQKPPR
jgi:hypothetical protein